ncbi:MAG TPA: protein kinase [Candidatus Eisenbacteria bacterium]|nr:protein kinase [Candidatus Eisenbacteria bacterium]
MIDKKLGPYKITEEIGSGGMATVYRAYQASMDRHVAVKVIRTSILHEPTLKERFRREARLIARLEHPHLLPVYDFDGDHEPPYIVMRYLEGGTLKQVLTQGELPYPEMLYTLKQVAAALDYAHRQGVVHRDLKPSNIMIDREGNAFVTDFGIARTGGTEENLTAAGDLIGTPAYMSPEQARGDSEIDGGADVYAFGAMVFEMLTGTPPYQHESSLGVLMAHLNDPVPSAKKRNSKLPDAVDTVIAKALDKDKTKRYASAETLVADLAKALKARQAEAPTKLQSFTQTLSLEQLKAFQKAQKTPKRETPSGATPTEQQRQMSTLYVDVTELAGALYELGQDAETVRARMEKLWTRFDEIAREEGGVIQSRTDDVGLALWGRARIREDDPERTIRAALRMQDATQAEAVAIWGKDWKPSDDNPLPFRAGITTGPVLLERSGDSGIYTASGSTITLAGRIKDSAPPGTVLVAHDTYSQVMGVFTAHTHEPLRFRGRKDPIEVYVVIQVKPRAFRLKARGIEGVETKMIGREIELRLLQEAFTLTVEDGETQVVTVVGEAGVGKSRLLFEFAGWSELNEQTFWQFEARATQPSMLQPYSLTRDLFSFRFQILDSDPLDVVHDKFVKGVAGFLGAGSEEKAELMAQLVGFDFSSFPRVTEALKDTEGFRKRALEHLGEFFTAASKVNPVVMHVEDIHWADDRSLDLLNNLVRENEKLPLFVLCMARPSLYERRPQWGEGQRFHERIALDPLSQLSSRRLVRELLKKMPEVPTALRDLIVDRADGNPFYIEELIKALIDDHVILKGEDKWSVDGTRLSAVRIPTTLTGVLQSRLDGLPLPLQQLLQRGSVAGRTFWDDLAVNLSTEAGLGADDVNSMLEELRQREMILRREESGFAGTVEYIFRHAILRDVTYETLVPRQRRALHKQVGDWLLSMGGERANELTLLVAEHYERAGEPGLAAERLRVAGEAALRVGAYEEALATLRRALDLVSAPEHFAVRSSVALNLSEVLSQTGRLTEATELLASMLPELRQGQDLLNLGRTLGYLGRIAMWQDDPVRTKAYLNEALEIARRAGDEPGLMFLLRQMGNITADDFESSKKFLEESIELARRLGNRAGEAAAMNSMGNTYQVARRFAESTECYNRSLQLGTELKSPYLMTMPSLNIAINCTVDGDLGKARSLLDASLARIRELGDVSMLPGAYENMGWLEIKAGNLVAAREKLGLALQGFRDQQSVPLLTITLLAIVEAKSGRPETGLEWIGLVRSQPTLYPSAVEFFVQPHWDEITAGLSAAEVDAALDRGKNLNMQDLLRQLAGEAEQVGAADAAGAAGA